MDTAAPVDPPGAQPEALAEAGAYATAADGFERGLVVLAMGLPYWLVAEGGRFRLMVEAARVADVREQIARFEAESRRWPPREPERAPLAVEGGLVAAVVWALGEIVVFTLQERWPGRLERAGALEPRALFERHEWWRCWTALGLHADAGHLGANLLGGLFAFSAVGIALGVGRGWALTAVAAGLGNLAAAAIHYPGPYVSLGASTAIFAALGVLTGHALLGCFRAARPWWNAAAPAGGGLAFLGLYGAGGLHTDVVAHATGFASGVLVGLAAARFGSGGNGVGSGRGRSGSRGHRSGSGDSPRAQA